MSATLQTELLDAGKAIGLLSSDGSLNPSWFQHPDTEIVGMLKQPAQRAAFLDLLDQLFPPGPIAGLPATEKWHPLLSSAPTGNLYCSVQTNDGTTMFGIAGDLQGSGAEPASLRAKLPIVSFSGSSPAAIAGSAQGPLSVSIRVPVNWTIAANGIGLKAIRFEIQLAPLVPKASAVVVLEGLNLDGGGAHDTTLDPSNLGPESTHVLLGLIHEKLRQIGAGATEAGATAAHLMPLFGLGTDGIPLFPFADLLKGPVALQSWLNTILSTGKMQVWMAHLAGLFGSSLPVTGSGTAADPWRVRIIALDAGKSEVAITIESAAQKLHIGVQVALVPSGATPPARLEASAAIATIPLSGTGGATVLPAASIVVRSPGGAGTLVNSGTIRADDIRGGVEWNGSALKPLLALENVTLNGTHYDRIDLTNADSVVSAATALVESAIKSALGSAGPAGHLLALAGIAAPASDPTFPFHVDLAKLVSNPAAAIGKVHRDSLASGTHPWGGMFAEVAGLLGIASPVTGAGTLKNPWSVPLGAPGPLTLALTAWNAQTSGVATDPQLLRIGIRLSASSTPWNAFWAAELLAFDLPSAGTGALSFVGGQHAEFSVGPVPAVAPFASVTVSADSIGVTLDWTLGSPLKMAGTITNIAITEFGVTTPIGSIKYPTAVAFDISNPGSSIGLTTAQLETVLRLLLARALYSWADMPGLAVGVLLGIRGNLAGLQPDWPVLRDPSGPGSLFTDPLGALRDWLGRVAVGVAAAEQTPFLLPTLDWLRALLLDQLPDSPTGPAPMSDSPIQGFGIYEAPWRLPLVGTKTNPVELLAWLEPAGPPVTWCAPLPARISAAGDFDVVLQATRDLGMFSAPVRDALGATDVDTLPGELELLEDYFAQSDGVVPVSSQIPAGGTWTAGTPLTCAHNKQPSDPSAINQILAKLNEWAPGNRAVLLLGPAFSDHTVWNLLLAQAEAGKPGSTNAGATFDLRVPNVSPSSIDLSLVTAVADYYTADLQDDGTGDLTSLTSQIGRLVARIGQLRPGVKVILAAHSTAGVAAREFTHANPSLVLGLVTIGTPHLGAPLDPIVNRQLADAVRLVQRLTPTLPAGSVNDAVLHLCQALDGFAPPLIPNGLPTPAPYPVGSFAGGATTDTAGVQAFALGGRLDGAPNGDLFHTFRSAIAAQATTAAAAAIPAPTHLAFAISVAFDLPLAGAGDIDVEARCRVDAFRVALANGLPQPAHRAHAVSILTTVTAPDGWVAGGPTSFLGLDVPRSETRVRWAEFGATLTPNAGGVAVAPVVRLHQAALHGTTQPLVQITDSSVAQLLGELFQAMNHPAPGPFSPVSGLFDALMALGIAVKDSTTKAISLSADAFAAIQVDAASFLVPRILTALSSPNGLAGISGPASGPWVLNIGTSGLQAYLSNTAGWRLGLRVVPPATIAFGSTAKLAFDARIGLPQLKGELDLDFTVAATTIAYSNGGQVTISAPPWLDPLPLPPSASALKTNLEKAIPRILLSSAVTSLLEGSLGPVFRIAPIDKLIGSPGQTMSSSGSLGNGSTLDATKINKLLQMIATAIGAPPGPGLTLPGDLQLTAAGADPLVFTLTTTTRLNGILDLAATLGIDSLRHVTPGGTASLHLTLPGTWGAAVITFGISQAGVTLTVTPSGLSPIQLLPTFSGLGALAAGGAALLPTALDALTGALSPSAELTAVLQLAQALDLHNGTDFSSKSDNWKALLQGGLGGIANRSLVLSRAATLLSSLGPIPGSISAGGNTLTWSFNLGAPLSGSAGFTLGWDGSGPTFAVNATNLKSNNGPLLLSFSAGAAAGGILASAGVGFNLEPSLHIGATPQFTAAWNGSAFSAHFYPLGDPVSSVFDIQLLPSPPQLITKSDWVDQFAMKWLLPIAADPMFQAASGQLSKHLWTGGPTLQQALDGAGLLTGTSLKSPLPPLTSIVTGFATTLASYANIPVTPTLSLSFVNEKPNGTATKFLGLRLTGHEDVNAGSLTASLRFGETFSKPSFFTDPATGVALYLFDAGLNFKPKLNIVGLGVGFAGQGGSPVINTSFLRTGQLGGYIFFDLDFAPSINFSNFGAGIEIDQFGIPLGQALGGAKGGDNPVAAGLMQSDGGSGGGDSQQVNPAIDFFALYRKGVFDIKVQNQTGAIWIGLHKKFGPIYIDQVGLEIVGAKSAAALLVDGSVQISGLTVQADELGVQIPLNALASPEKWSLDLRGLAVSYDSSGVKIAGGLLKNPGPPVEYDGMLMVEVAGKGFTAVGAYARPSDALGSYTSLFIFVSLPIVLGGPPFFFVTGLGGGAGINRRLLPPTDPNQVPNFLLVAAIDDSSFANNPMGALKSIATNLPARRGSYWFAAGVRFTSFVLVESVAVIYVALDRGFEIGVLGVSRMALPTEDLAIASIELALKARFSTAEGILSVQAQLTDNSYLLSRDCQLTGGFAFFTWFTKGQFLITVGGYHPAFQKPPEFPSVPRVGFHWSVSDAIVIKGEAYFALTNSCVMAGGRLEATAHFGPVRAWFIAYADFLISWDPFHYDINIGVSIGVALDFDVCFIICGHVHIEVSIGAGLHIIGPPLHGTVTFTVLFFTVTVPFGPDPQDPPNYIKDFSVFADKYLNAGDADKKVVGVRVSEGLLPPDPPGAKPSPGSNGQPWQLNAEWVFVTETRMPASSFSTFVTAPTGQLSDAALIDLAAMHELNVDSNHDVRIFVGNSNTAAPTDAAHFVIEKTISPFPEATWRFTDPNAVKAAARTLPALSGLTIQGIAVLQGQSALIPISFMVDDLPERTKPLPFATITASLRNLLITYGTAASTLAQSLEKVPSSKMLDAAQAVLSGNNLFSQQRASLGIEPQGLAPLSVRSLKRFRSAPPLVAPITTGLTMEPVGLAAPFQLFQVTDTTPVLMRQPRLRAVLRHRPQPTTDAPARIRTTVFNVQAAKGVPRHTPPVPMTLTGAVLRTLSAPRAPQPTGAAISTATLHHPEIGASTGPGHFPAFQKATIDLLRDGIVLPSGTSHVWDLPDGFRGGFVVTGTGAYRMVALDRGGVAVFDREMTQQSAPISVPPTAVTVVFQCLGNTPQPFPAENAFGAVCSNAAPGTGLPAVGWQSGNFLAQVGPATLLGRGATIRLARHASPRVRGLKTSYSMVRVSQSTLGQQGIETRLPSSTTVVMILLDGQDPTAAADGDLALAVEGARFVTPPIPVGGGRRRALLYDVTYSSSVLAGFSDAHADSFTVSAASKKGWQVSGVAGLHGKAIEWANRLHGDVPERVVPDGPLTAEGSVRIRFVQTQT
jgi:large repetitive protein